MTMTKLDSVGSTLNTETGVVYSLLLSGGYDENTGTHLEDCCEEWYSKLSVEDLSTITRTNNNRDFYGHWVQANGKPHTKETMQALAIERFEVLLNGELEKMGYPSDGAKGQAQAFAKTMIEALK